MGCFISCLRPHNKQIELVTLNKPAHKTVVCTLCGKESENPVKMSSISKKFCSMHCWETWMRKDKRIRNKI